MGAGADSVAAASSRRPEGMRAAALPTLKTFNQDLRFIVC
jgi:hypothetical protein